MCMTVLVSNVLFQFNYEQKGSQRNYLIKVTLLVQLEWRYATCIFTLDYEINKIRYYAYGTRSKVFETRRNLSVLQILF